MRQAGTAGSLWFRCALALGAALIPMPTGAALASAFNEPAGQGVVIVGGTLSGGNRSFTRDGRHVVRTDAYRKREVSAYVEYGLTDWLQIMFKPDLLSTSLGGKSGDRYAGFGTSEAGAQLQLPSFGPVVLAAQGSFQLPATTQQRNRALIGNTSQNADGRALLGYAFPLGSWPSFLDAEMGYRIRGSGAPDEAHADLTLGTRPLPALLLLLQTFTTLPVGKPTPWFPTSQYSNVEASAVYDLTPHWSVQLGAFETIEGRNALREQGATIAVWYRF